MSQDKATTEGDTMATPTVDTDRAAEFEPVRSSAIEEEETTVEQANDLIEDVQPQTEPRVWNFEGMFDVENRGRMDTREFKGEYVQEPLSYMGMLEFTGLLGRTIDAAMSGPNGLTIDGLIGADGVMPIAHL